jgi:uncharacterized protein YaiI (UPF0178 family)
MQILVDADACPTPVREILFKAAERTGTRLALVANRVIRVPPSPLLSAVLVGAGADVADSEIVRRMEPGDLVITADIPLAALVVDKGGLALNPRGELYSAENIRERLSMRDFMADLRMGGVETGGPPSFGKGDRQAFANQLDRLLARAAKGIF